VFVPGNRAAHNRCPGNKPAIRKWYSTEQRILPQSGIRLLSFPRRKQNRVAANPFEIVNKVDMRGKETFHRRELSGDEACRMLNGESRLLYLLVLHTELRRGEINALLWGHLHLDGPNPFYALPAKSS
jgi:integrase